MRAQGSPAGCAGGCGFSTFGSLYSAALTQILTSFSPAALEWVLLPSTHVGWKSSCHDCLPASSPSSVLQTLAVLTVAPHLPENGYASWQRAFLHLASFHLHGNSGPRNGLPVRKLRLDEDCFSWPHWEVKPHLQLRWSRWAPSWRVLCRPFIYFWYLKWNFM